MAASPEVVHSPKKQVVLVIGSGGREHAIVHKLAASIRVKSIFVAPGNFGTAMEMTSECPVTNVDVNTEDISTVVGFVQENDVDFVVVGPEQPLVDGLVDALLEKVTFVIVIQSIGRLTKLFREPLASAQARQPLYWKPLRLGRRTLCRGTPCLPPSTGHSQISLLLRLICGRSRTRWL